MVGGLPWICILVLLLSTTLQPPLPPLGLGKRSSPRPTLTECIPGEACLTSGGGFTVAWGIIDSEDTSMPPEPSWLGRPLDFPVLG